MEGKLLKASFSSPLYMAPTFFSQKSSLEPFLSLHFIKEEVLLHQSFSNFSFQVLHPAALSININDKIWEMYFHNLLPRLVEDREDGNCGSTAVCHTICLQALSKSIQFAKFVAEAKFRDNPGEYEKAIKAQDGDELMRTLTYKTVEEKVKKRVQAKA